MLRRFLPAAVALGSALFVVVACGSDTDDKSSSSSGGSGGLGSSGIGASGSSSGDLSGCATNTLEGKTLPLDIYIMLDASGSMNEKTGDGSGPTKLAAVKDALKGFINDPSSTGVGVGLQIFPIVHAGAPASCTQNSECNVGGADYGRCFLKACYNVDPQQSCDTSGDCPGNAGCYPLGTCANDPNVTCLVGAPATGCTAGACNQWGDSQCDKAECFQSDYDTARIAIGTLPANATALVSTIDGIPNPPDSANTPTSTALKGAIDVAANFSSATPGHAVVVVFATDGLPTRCLPLDTASIANIAKDGVNGTPSIKTYVLGVFADSEKATAQANLDAIAVGGGTTKAQIVNTSGANVAADFKAALDVIRGAALPCEYAVPTTEAGEPDFDKVNVQFTPAGGQKSVISQTKTCDATGGWHYDVDPTTGATPTKIVLCQSSCDAVKAGSGNGAKVEVVLGCKTQVK